MLYPNRGAEQGSGRQRGVAAGVSSAEVQAESLARIIVAAPMKSGSTYVANVLGRYFGITEPLNLAVQVDFEAQHDLTPWLFLPLRGKSFCFNLHMLPHRINLQTAAEERIALVGLWRNLGDMIVSLDDHSFREGGNGPALFLMRHDKYRALPAEERLAFAIDTVVPWYVRFYLSWRSANMTLHPYEQLLRDRRAHVAAILAPLLAHPPIEELLDASLGGKGGADDRLNVGRAGRSAEHLDTPAKRRLEERLLLHPDREQLEILLWELPWEVPALAPCGPLDGAVVRTERGPHPFFVSRGVAYPIVRSSWLGSRVGERRVPRLVAEEELAPYPVGEPLI
jgi:hypothetical protein